MARPNFKEIVSHEPVVKGTSIGRGKVKLNSMNKSKRRSYKKYNRQGR